MKHSIPVNNLLVCDAVGTGHDVLKEIQAGSEWGLRYMNQRFHLELWYFAYGFMDEKEAFGLALRIIRMHWEDRFSYHDMETLETVIYTIMIFYCLPYVKESPGGKLLVKDICIPEPALHYFMEKRKAEAMAFSGKAQQHFFPPSLS
jgi:hypothetical protein